MFTSSANLFVATTHRLCVASEIFKISNPRHYFLDRMSDNSLSSDIHVLVDGSEEKYFKSVTFEREEDGLTKMSWVTEITATELDRHSENDDFFVKKTLLLGKFYSPYQLVVFFSRSDTGHSQYNVEVGFSRPRDHPLEDKNNQEASSTKKDGEYFPLSDIWISVNQKEKIPFERKLIDDLELWMITQSSHQLEPPQTYTFNFQLWFKLINQSAPLAEKNALKQFSTLYVDQTDCDINFCFENGHSVGGHKNILKARSPVFAAMFQHEMQEAKTGQVVITDIQPDIFRELLFFIYSGQLETPLTEEKAKMLFVAADKYDIGDLKKICLLFLLRYIHTKNVLHLMVWAHNYSVDKLKEAALKFVADNFDLICLMEEWVNFTREYPDLNVLATREMVKKRKRDEMKK